MSDKSRPIIGEYLKDLRQHSGLSLRHVGKAALSSSYLSQLENGKVKDIPISKLETVAEAYGVPVTAILTDVYGMQIEVDPNSEAAAIGRLVMALPEAAKSDIIGYTKWQLAQLPSAEI